MWRPFSLLVLFCFFALATFAQTSSFTYQGKLTDGGGLANAPYDFIFRLFDASGTQIGFDIPKDDVQVAAGIFTVTLDFGSSPFGTGLADSLEIAVRPGASTGAFTTLTPRQPLTSSPYAIRSENASTSDTATTANNALSLGGVAANQYVVTSDPRMTDPRDPNPGSQSYIHNGTGQQTASNFNISGNGTVAGTMTGGSLSFSNNAFIGGSANILGGVGIGTGFPTFKLHVIDASNSGLRVQTNTAGGTVASFGGSGSFEVDAPGIAGGRLWITEAGDTLIGANTTGKNLNVTGNGSFTGNLTTSRFSVGTLQATDTISITSSAARPVAIGAYSSQANNAVVQVENSNASGIGIVAAGGNVTPPSFTGFSFGLGAYGNRQAIEADYSNVSPFGYAIFTHGPAGNAAINEFDGVTQFKIIGAGVVSTVVKDSAEKNRVLFAPEAPEVLFEDYGTGQLAAGKAQITIDPMFAANVAIDGKHPLRVFVQLEGDCNGVYVTNKSASGFEVVELAGGNSNVGFSWHVVANRRDEELGGSDPEPDGSLPQKRTSHYQDLRFPVQKDMREILKQEFQRKSP